MKWILNPCSEVVAGCFNFQSGNVKKSFSPVSNINWSFKKGECVWQKFSTEHGILDISPHNRSYYLVLFCIKWAVWQCEVLTYRYKAGVLYLTPTFHSNKECWIPLMKSILVSKYYVSFHQKENTNLTTSSNSVDKALVWEGRAKSHSPQWALVFVEKIIMTGKGGKSQAHLSSSFFTGIKADDVGKVRLFLKSPDLPNRNFPSLHFTNTAHKCTIRSLEQVS